MYLKLLLKCYALLRECCCLIEFHSLLGLYLFFEQSMLLLLIFHFLLLLLTLFDIIHLQLAPFSMLTDLFSLYLLVSPLSPPPFDHFDLLVSASFRAIQQSGSNFSPFQVCSSTTSACPPPSIQTSSWRATSPTTARTPPV